MTTTRVLNFLRQSKPQAANYLCRANPKSFLQVARRHSRGRVCRTVRSKSGLCEAEWISRPPLSPVLHSKPCEFHSSSIVANNADKPKADKWLCGEFPG